MNAPSSVLQPRIDIRRHFTSGAARALLALQHEVETGSLGHTLIELVKIRASQINGCAYCIDMHTTDARALGETEQRIYGLSAWHETPFYTPRERAALAWTEAVTLLSETHVPDAVHDEVRAHFDEPELVELTWAIVAINAWNRLAVSFRSVPGTYRRAKA